MKKLIIFIGILAICAGIFGYYKYNQPHKVISESEADFVMTPSDLLQSYETDEKAADLAYLDKIIKVMGKVRDINMEEKGASLSLDTGNAMSSIICEFESGDDLAKIQVGDSVTIKGICTGKLMDIVLVRCSL